MFQINKNRTPAFKIQTTLLINSYPTLKSIDHSQTIVKFRIRDLCGFAKELNYMMHLRFNSCWTKSISFHSWSGYLVI